MIISRPLRVLRGVTAATIATFIALVAHVSAGAPVPGVMGIFVPWLFSVLLCIPVVGRRLSVWGLASGVLLSQLLFHALFVLGTNGAVAMTPVEGGVHVHGLGPMPAVGETVGAGIDPAAEALLLGPLMWATHVFASIMTTVLLHSGERFVVLTLRVAGQWNDWWARWMPRLVTVTGVRVVLAIPDAPFRGITVPHLTSLIRRGPPRIL